MLHNVLLQCSSCLPHFEGKSAALTDLLNKKHPSKLTDKDDEDFHKIKEAICSAPRLAYQDTKQKICLQTDASNMGLGAVVFQEKEDRRR